MKKTADAIVVGGGVIGLLTARELQAQGLSVTVLERGRIGKASSQAGGGILSPIPPWEAPAAVTVLANQSALLYPDLAGSLMASTGVDIQYLQSGVLLLGEEGGSEAHDWAGHAGQIIEVLNQTRLREQEPALHSAWQCALFLPGIAQLRNPRLTRALSLDLHEKGVVLKEQTAVTGFSVAGDRVTGVHSTGGDVLAQHIIVAAGAWTGELLGNLASAKIGPVRGQMLWYQVEPGLFNSMIIEGDQYLIPRRDGVCLVGSTVEHVGFDNTITAPAGEQLAALAARLSPVFKGRKPSGHWSGLRPGKADGIPIVSAHPELAGLFIHAGHYRNGINLAPASAKLMCEIVLGNKPDFDSAPYRLANRLY